ncbi:uncharacterized protein F4822DRAFT_425620 [Hypoxylon trugodes]|uniref:uncharacterized protein n=1 Tax=Hypoxylon trugodes TaxID=326681 RepID=UPI0021908225|nr:uncharacterized protein F4822DRAFT_425620 [Hypoxylon trugodes]KAI1392410.1 hypothetical protein F4822DRAFT_425620 [Hypoxylon trugodes]
MYHIELLNPPRVPSPSGPEDILIDIDSTFSPYTVPKDSYSGPRYTDHIDWNQKYVTCVASTLLTPEELELVRGHLEDRFHEEVCGRLRYRQTFLSGWARSLLMAPAPQYQFNVPICWSPDIFDYANKQTAVYFVGGGPNPESVGHRHGYSDSRLGCYIYRLWYTLHGGRPNLQRQHFFAKALRLPKSEAADWIIPQLLVDHHRLCDATETCLENDVVRLYCEDSANHNFPAAGWDGEDVAVLMVRTGNDVHLSRPVSFEGLVREGKTFPLGLEEGKLAEGFDVVRVKVAVAMRFLFDLQAREEAAIPSLRQESAELTEERERACHAWVESVLQHASLSEVGIDGNEFTWEAVRRMWAKRDGEIFNRRIQDETRLMPLYSWWWATVKPMKINSL